MVVPDISVLVAHAKDIVSSAGEKGELSALTHRIVRKEIEKQLSLSQGALDVSEFRKPLKSAITAAVEDARGKKKTARAVSVLSLSSADEERKIKKKPPTKQRNGGKASTSKEDGPNKLKSAEFVASDVDSEDEDTKASSKSTATNKKLVLVLSDEEPEGDGSRASSKPTVAVTKRVMHDSKRTEETKGSSKAISSREKRLLSSEDSGEISDINSGAPKSRKVDEKSDTELSDLIDEPPKKKKASKSHVKPVSREKTQATKKKSTEPVNKDEETIKRLKSLVTACGIRKVWSKVFVDMDKPSQKIRKLKEILSDLGMKGRFSVEQAKAIRTKRELAQELEDVQSFERSVARKGEKKRSTPESDSEGEDEDEEPKPKRRKENARQSIMAFLQDQSESE